MNVQHPRDLCRKLAIHYNLQTLRQRREIFELTANSGPRSVRAMMNLANDLQVIIDMGKKFDDYIEYHRDSVYRQEFEHVAQREEHARNAARDLADIGEMDRERANQWLRETVAITQGLKRKRQQRWDEDL